MRYASIRKMDIVNGEGIGVALFVQGCHFHCKGCFNQETWDFSGGEEWDKDVEEYFFQLIDRPYINHISILGGEPLCPENINDITDIVKNCKKKFSNKKIWLWSGYTFEDYIYNKEIVNYLDYIIDGRYIDNLRDTSLMWRGSSNQNVIDVKKTVEQGVVVLCQ